MGVDIHVGEGGAQQGYFKPLAKVKGILRLFRLILKGQAWQEKFLLLVFMYNSTQ